MAAHAMSILRLTLFAGSAFALTVAIIVWFSSRRHQPLTGFMVASREHAVVASDVGIGSPLVLRDRASGIVGIPDYLLQVANGRTRELVPMEVKPNRRAERPYDSDSLQLAAYIVALRTSSVQNPATYGYLRYATGTFRVELTRPLEARVLRVVDAIRRDRRASVVHRDHRSSGRCAACGVREYCNEALR
jgi:CRISPR-associated exonuclease Cas4